MKQLAIVACILLLLSIVHCSAPAHTVDADRIQVIAFPADRATFANGSAVPSSLHVLCGWWDRADSFSFDPLSGSCDFVRANYAIERNLSCYASDPRLAIDRSIVACRLDGGVVQDSCFLILDAVHWREPAPTWRASDANVPRNERTVYERARDEYMHLLDHQIVARRSPIKLLTCQINSTAIVEVGQKAVASVYRMHTHRISVSKAAELLLSYAESSVSDKEYLEILYFFFAVFMEASSLAIAGFVVVLVVAVLYYACVMIRQLCVAAYRIGVSHLIGLCLAAFFPLTCLLLAIFHVWHMLLA